MKVVDVDIIASTILSLRARCRSPVGPGLKTPTISPPINGNRPSSKVTSTGEPSRVTTTYLFVALFRSCSYRPDDNVIPHRLNSKACGWRGGKKFAKINRQFVPLAIHRLKYLLWTRYGFIERRAIPRAGPDISPHRRFQKRGHPRPCKREKKQRPDHRLERHTGTRTYCRHPGLERALCLRLV
jgi:hypothetical protein